MIWALLKLNFNIVPALLDAIIDYGENNVNDIHSELTVSDTDNLSNEDMIEIIEKYKEVYNENDSADDWFPRLRDMAEEMGYAKAPKLYKKNPEEFKGHVGDVAGVIRVAVTGRRMTPDLYEILQTLGTDEVIKRFDAAIEALR